MDIDEIVIENITRLMSLRGLSQKGLADNAKVNYQNLNRLLRRKGQRSIYKSDILPTIATFFGVTVTYLSTKNDYSIEIPKTIKTPAPDRATRILALQSKLLELSEDKLGAAEMAINGLVDLSKKESKTIKKDEKPG